MVLFEGFERRIGQLYERLIVRQAKIKDAKLPTVTQMVEVTVPQDVGIFIQNVARSIGRPANAILSSLCEEGLLAAAYDPDEEKEGKRAPSAIKETTKGKRSKSGGS